MTEPTQIDTDSVSAADEQAEWQDLGLSIETRLDFAPGVPEDPASIPVLHYQVLAGKVFTLMRWPDGSTARGETSIETLARLAGGPVAKEGWYNVLGKYLGAELPGSL